MKRNARKKNNREKNCRKRKTKNVKRLALWHQQHGTSALSIYTSWLPILADCWMHTRAQVLTSLLLSILCVYMLLVFAHFVVRTSCIVPSHCITLHRTSMYKQRQKCKNKRHLFFQSLADKTNLFKYEANARASTRNSLHKLHTWCGSQQKIEQQKKTRK